MPHLSLQQQRTIADRKGLAVLAAAALAIAGVIAALAANLPPPRDPLTGCLTDRKLAARTTVILDKTDPWNANHASLLEAALLNRARRMAVEDRLTLIAFDGRPERPPVALFDRCKPPPTCNIVVCTPHVIEDAYQATFAQPLAEALAALTSPSRAPQTHLVQFLANVAAHLGYEPRATTTSIVIYGDMAEHAPPNISVYPHVRTRLPFTPAAFTRYVNELMRDRLQDISLDIHTVPTTSTTPLLQQRIRHAWVAALSANAIRFSWNEL